MKKRITCIVFALGTLICTESVKGQEQFAIFDGLVADARTGETLPFANLLILNSDDVLIAGASSDMDGNINIKPLPPGSVKIKVTYPGYEDLSFDAFDLIPGENSLVALLEPDSAYDIVEQALVYRTCCVFYCTVTEVEVPEVVVFEEVEQAKLSIDNQELVELGFRIFPNPANDFVTLEFAEDVPSIQLVDFNGRILTDEQATAFQRTRLPVSLYPSGFYTLRFLLNGKWESEKIVIGH